MGRSISKEKIKMILDLHKQGLTYREISDRAGVAISTVNVYIKNSKVVSNEQSDIELENEELKKENKILYETIDDVNDRIDTYKSIIEELRLSYEQIEINSLECEKILVSKFPVLYKNRTEGLYSEYAKLAFGGIITSASIRNEGGLYMALACVLSLHYNTLDKISKIDKFLDKYSLLQSMSFNRIAHRDIKKIMNEFLEITE